MRRTLFAALVLALAPAVAGADVPLCPVKVLYDEPGLSASGSGTVVACEGDGANCRALVLTCRHVCPSGRGKCAVVAAGKTYPAEWVDAPERADLAALVIKADLPYCRVADSEPPRGTPLRQWGYPGGQLAPKTGTAEGYRGVAVRHNPGRWVPAAFRNWTNTLPTAPGDSGAGVFDPDGRLVAVCWGRDPINWSEQSCVGVGDVRRFLRGVADERFPELRERVK